MLGPTSYGKVGGLGRWFKDMTSLWYDVIDGSVMSNSDVKQGGNSAKYLITTPTYTTVKEWLTIIRQNKVEML